MAQSSLGSRMVDRESSTPLHIQLEDVILEKIANDEWPPNAQIPSENELSLIYGLSRMTTRMVLTRLVLQGCCPAFPAKARSSPRQRSSVGPSFPWASNANSTRRGSRAIFDSSVYRVLKQAGMRDASCGSNATRWFGRSNASEQLDGEPLSVHLSYVPVSLCPDLDAKGLENGQLRNVLEREYNLLPLGVEESVETALAGESVANT